MTTPGSQHLRIALVTGSSYTKGIGYAIAHRLAGDGLHVAVSDRPATIGALQTLRDELAARYPKQRFVAVAADTTSEPDVQRMFNEVVNELGGLDVVSATCLRELRDFFDSYPPLS
jgi:NAD(P)-dependent dehydrogenase (short-subunit alcohol dehydrogenase family)